MLARIIFALSLAIFVVPEAAGSERVVRAPADVKLDEMIPETQKSLITPTSIEIVWWIPSQYWAAAFAMQPNVSEKAKALLEQTFAQYTFIAAVKGRVSDKGIDGFVEAGDMRERIRIVDAAGIEYRPIALAEQNPLLTAVVNEVKPVLSSSMGPMGANMNFYAFPKTGKDGKPLADPLADGRLLIALDDTRHALRLPLDSLLVPARDSKTGEIFPGSFQFNPYTGTALESAADKP